MLTLSMRGLKYAIIAAGLLLAVQPPSHAAGSLTGTFSVTANITGGACSSISAGALSFGSLAPAAQANSSTTVTINCASGAPFSLSAVGSSPACFGSELVNLMTNNPSNLNVPAYGLYADSARTQPLSAGATNPCGGPQTAISGTGTGANQTVTIYATVAGTAPGNSPTPAGSYSDVATMTLTF